MVKEYVVDPYPKAPSEAGTIWVGNLPFSATWHDLKDLASSCGRVVRAEVIMDAPGKSRGMGLVMYETREEAEAAVEQLHLSVFDDRELKVRLDLLSNRTGCTVHVGNLPYSLNWQKLKDLCRPYGRVLRCDVARDYNGESKGYGTVVFGNPAEAQRAIEALDQVVLEKRKLRPKLDKFSRQRVVPRPYKHEQKRKARRHELEEEQPA